MDKDQELRGWKAHCVELQDRVDRLELENSRLQSVIDAANAQEPISNVDVYYDSNDSGDRILTWDTFGLNFKSLGVGKHKLYARPIPAQQSQALAVPEKIGFSEALKVCDIGFTNWKLKEHNKKWFKRIDGTPIPNDLLCCIAEAFSNNGENEDLMEFHALGRFEDSCAKSDPARITEQDAREIVTAWAKYVDDHDETVAIPDFEWSHHEWKFILRGILNKLNEKKNG